MRLIDADVLMNEFRSYMVENYDKDKCVSAENCNTCNFGCLWRKKVNAAPTVDAVSRGVFDQVMWERDVAIEQLKSYGVSFGEKADVVKVVRCKDCRSFLNEDDGWCLEMDRNIEPNAFCSYGKRKDNE